MAVFMTVFDGSHYEYYFNIRRLSIRLLQINLKATRALRQAAVSDVSATKEATRRTAGAYR